MRKIVAITTVVSAALASAPAAHACDLEGFGVARVNPFARHAAWNVPKDAPNRQQSENSAGMSAQALDEADRSSAQDAAPSTFADQALADAAPKAFTVSQVTPADQAKRFTATKD